MTFQELKEDIKRALASSRGRPPGPRVIKEMLWRAATMAEPPPTPEEFVAAMRELGLRPGYD